MSIKLSIEYGRITTQGTNHYARIEKLVTDESDIEHLKRMAPGTEYSLSGFFGFELLVCTVLKVKETWSKGGESERQHVIAEMKKVKLDPSSGSTGEIPTHDAPCLEPYKDFLEDCDWEHTGSFYSRPSRKKTKPKE